MKVSSRGKESLGRENPARHLNYPGAMMVGEYE